SSSTTNDSPMPTRGRSPSSADTMKSLLRSLFLLMAPGWPGLGWAQQLPQLTQYQFNDYVINPAVAGSRPLFEIRSGHRYQWVGIQDAPRTFTLSTATPVGRNMGV